MIEEEIEELTKAIAVVCMIAFYGMVYGIGVLI